MESFKRGHGGNSRLWQGLFYYIGVTGMSTLTQIKVNNTSFYTKYDFFFHQYYEIK